MVVQLQTFGFTYQNEYQLSVLTLKMSISSTARLKSFERQICRQTHVDEAICMSSNIDTLLYLKNNKTRLSIK